MFDNPTEHSGTKIVVLNTWCLRICLKHFEGIICTLTGDTLKVQFAFPNKSLTIYPFLKCSQDLRYNILEQFLQSSLTTTVFITKITFYNKYCE